VHAATLVSTAREHTGDRGAQPGSEGVGLCRGRRRAALEIEQRPRFRQYPFLEFFPASKIPSGARGRDAHVITVSGAGSVGGASKMYGILARENPSSRCAKTRTAVSLGIQRGFAVDARSDRPRSGNAVRALASDQKFEAWRGGAGRRS